MPCRMIVPAPQRNWFLYDMATIFGCLQRGGADTYIVQNNETSYTMLPLLKGQLLVAASEESSVQTICRQKAPLLSTLKLYNG